LFVRQARTIYSVDLKELKYRTSDGVKKVHPPEDLSGHWWDEEKREMK
jgi:hypothetical protein